MINLIDRNLPKWPQMFVSGDPVSIEQAKEIIRRTDRFFQCPKYSGNNRAYSNRVMEALKFPKGDESDILFDKEDQWRQNWNYINTEYVFNDWIACSFIGGPHGWCNPDGKIYFSDNVGKWPSVQDIHKDWVVLAREFPFVRAGITLMDRESCEENKNPVVSMLVEKGKVYLIDPEEKDVHEEFNVRPPTCFEEGFKYAESLCDFLNREQGIQWSWIEEWSKLFK